MNRICVFEFPSPPEVFGDQPTLKELVNLLHAEPIDSKAVEQLSSAKRYCTYIS